MRLGIRSRMVVAAALVVSVVLLAVGQLVRSSTETEFREQATREGLELATGHAAAVESTLRQALVAADDLGSALTALHDNGAVDRTLWDAVIRQHLVDHPNVLGSWTGWEAGALDDLDAFYAGTPGYDETGRYLPYWNRGGGTVTRDVLVDYGVAGAGDYYQIPFTTGADKVIDPYVYPVGGKDVVMTSLTTPVFADGKAVGVAGVDIDLSELAKSIDEIRPLGGGSAVLLSTNGAVVAGLGQDRLGTSLEEGSPIASVVEAVRGGAPEAQEMGADPLGGEPAFLAAVPVHLTDADTWTLVVAVPEAAALAGLHHTNRVVWIATLVGVIVGALALFVLGTSLVRPVRRLSSTMDRLAEGDLDVEIPGRQRTDEIGTMATTVEVFRQRLVERRELEAAQSLADEQARVERAALTDRTARAFEDTMRGVVAGVTNGASLLEGGVHDMAAATQQLGSAIEDISREAIDATETANLALREAERTGEVIQTLSAAAGAIGATVDLVQSIAEQTNLLALNATIESARAGDAGRGFAVVAHEVKALAEETAKATQDISGRIRAIQTSTADAVSAIGQIAETITAVNRASVHMAAELSDRNLTSSVASVVDRSRAAAEQLIGTAGEVARSADLLVSQVDRFGSEVRSAI